MSFKLYLKLVQDILIAYAVEVAAAERWDTDVGSMWFLWNSVVRVCGNILRIQSAVLTQGRSVRSRRRRGGDVRSKIKISVNLLVG